MGGYNHPLHALIKMWISFFPLFFGFAGAGLCIKPKERSEKKSIFFLIISLTREDNKKKEFVFFSAD
jgi:hypothetical protein